MSQHGTERNKKLLQQAAGEQPFATRSNRAGPRAQTTGNVCFGLKSVEPFIFNDPGTQARIDFYLRFASLMTIKLFHLARRI